MELSYWYHTAEEKAVPHLSSACISPFLTTLKRKIKNMSETRDYPIGIQSFEKLRNEQFLYVDKTEFVYKLTSNGSVIFNT